MKLVQNLFLLVGYLCFNSIHLDLTFVFAGLFLDLWFYAYFARLTLLRFNGLCIFCFSFFSTSIFRDLHCFRLLFYTKNRISRKRKKQNADFVPVLFFILLFHPALCVKLREFQAILFSRCVFNRCSFAFFLICTFL